MFYRCRPTPAQPAARRSPARARTFTAGTLPHPAGRHSSKALLRLLDPARVAEPALSEEETEILRIRIISSERHLSRPHPRRRLLVWASAVTVTGGRGRGGYRPGGQACPGFCIRGHSGGSGAGGCPGRSRDRHSSAVGAGGGAGPNSRQWQDEAPQVRDVALFPRIDGDPSEGVPQSYGTWQQPGGSPRQVQTANGTSTTVGFPSSDRPDSPRAPRPESMKQWVLSQRDGTGAGAFLNRLNERSLGTVLTPQQSAGILRALASFGGVEYHRGVQDRPDVRGWFSPSSPISGASAEEAGRHLRPGYRETPPLRGDADRGCRRSERAGPLGYRVHHPPEQRLLKLTGAQWPEHPLPCGTAWLTVYDGRRASVQLSPGGGTKK